MFFGSKKDDAKIRLRCAECGQKLKLPACEPGHIYRCPICAHPIVAPLESGAAPAQASVPKREIVLPTSPKPSAARLMSQIASWTPQRQVTIENKSIERLIRFINAQNDKLCELAIAAIHCPENTEDQKIKRLQTMRQEKSKAMRAEIDEIVAGLDERIRKIARDPRTSQPAYRAPLDAVRGEKRGFLLFLRILFDLRLADTHPEAPQVE
ncbi:MAG TPA: hypothetical protein P5137_11020 [Candidatus Brocadiia bacterium]|nr:hypothetical protein [Candidatus Brocadiia bacterium]